ncbi:hypothetical protein V1514DRAFT_306584 [Lipomyces japonicus]|uniref:uncharacterized protein n=1 Tax=Lipomyces japonicus TaxID=56871 RepID=UPI0034CDB7BA
MTVKPAQFAPFRSFVDPPFFQNLSDKKLNEYRLDDSEREVWSTYEIPVSKLAHNSGIITLNGNSLTLVSESDIRSEFIARGTMKNFNTVEEFKSFDKGSLIQDQGQQIANMIEDDSIFECPSKLISFYLLIYSDIKKYKFYYWFGFPAIHSDWSFKHEAQSLAVSQERSRNVIDAIKVWQNSVSLDQRGFFLLKYLGTSWKVGKLKEWDEFFAGGDEIILGFADPSNLSGNPGWPLRNFLYLAKRKGAKSVKILCYRDLVGLESEFRSIWIDLERISSDTEDTIRVTGWERNANNKLTPKVSDLGLLMDPKRLADQALDLNLKLMKWRIAPDLDLDKIKNTKCLLLGAGTLGSYVARALMGWGVRNITFVDNASVSFSNPVRQPLYTFNDCLNGGAVKAERAAEALKEIYPGVNSSGYSLSVPMAGHPISNEKQQREEYETLEKLIDEHDALFLLMDSREVRWLPTVIASARKKIVINAALGFDSFVVMRHGVPLSKEERVDNRAERLGCYFCNDIYAPSDSLSARTLDQMCTVTRSGVSLIASGLVAELFVSIVQHPLGPAAAAPNSINSGSVQDNNDFVHPLGTIPHQLRGFLHDFSQMKIRGEPYEFCSACSDPILREWRENGWEFVKNALNIPKYVDEISGLLEVRRTADEIIEGEDWDISDDEKEEEV